MGFNPGKYKTEGSREEVVRAVPHYCRQEWTQQQLGHAYCHFSPVPLCDPLDCGPSGSSAHGILQARILDSVAIPLPGDLPDPGLQPAALTSPALAGGFFPTSATQAAKQTADSNYNPPLGSMGSGSRKRLVKSEDAQVRYIKQLVWSTVCTSRFLIPKFNQAQIDPKFWLSM